MRLVHIIAGLLGLASGAVALYALKGAELHRKSGMIFVYTMLVMSGIGAVMAALVGIAGVKFGFEALNSATGKLEATVVRLRRYREPI